MATIPAKSCNGTMSTFGYFLTIIIKTANELGIIKATIFPDNCPGDKELPTISIIPEIARIIEVKVNLDIFSFKNKYPKIAKKIA